MIVNQTKTVRAAPWAALIVRTICAIHVHSNAFIQVIPASIKNKKPPKN